MAQEQQQAAAQPLPQADADRDKLVKQIADRVWQLWQEDMRRQRERLGAKSGR